MTWDPRDLGQPRRIAHPPASPEPPAPPPRSYELRLADWDDARVTAERAGLKFRDPLPFPDDENGVPLYTQALQEQLHRDIYGMLYGRRVDTVTVDQLREQAMQTVERVSGERREPMYPYLMSDGFKSLVALEFGYVPVKPLVPLLPVKGHFTVKAGPKADAVLGHAEGQEVKLDGLPWGVVETTRRLPDGSAQCTVRLGSAKPMNDFLRQKYPYPTIDFGDLSREALDASHRALVDIPTATMREIIMTIPGATGDACGDPDWEKEEEEDLADWLEDETEYRGMDAD